MTTPLVQVNFRMPAELKDRLEASAKEAGRSTTAEIVTRLEESLNAPSPGAVMKALARLEFALAEKDLQLRNAIFNANTLARMAEFALPVFRDSLVRDRLPESEIQPLYDLIATAKAAREALGDFDGNLESDPAVKRWNVAAKRLAELMSPAERDSD